MLASLAKTVPDREVFVQQRPLSEMVQSDYISAMSLSAELLSLSEI